LAGEAAPVSGKVSDPRSKPVLRPNFQKPSAEQLQINQQQPIDKRDRSFLTHSRPRDASDTLPTWPAVAPLGERELREQEANGVRNVGTAHCAFEPCQTEIYENTGGNSIGSFGDPDGIPLCDDINFLASTTDRFVCKVNVSIGGTTGTNVTDTVGISLRSGNFFPICPDDPASTVIYCTTRTYTTSNPPNLLTVEIDPPILVDANFIWVCLQSTNGDAAWSISTTAEQGFTEDDIVIPNTARTWANCAAATPGSFCEDLGPGQQDDYFWYGGPPTIAGMFVEIFANPGPQGACCDRDQSPATCSNGVLRADCLGAGSTRAWKQGLCADFDGTTPHCTTCLTDATCMSGSTVSAEPNCGPGYVDVTNAGCESSPTHFETLLSPVVTCPHSICGTSGTYQSFCTVDADCNQGILCVSSVCQGADDSRDSDWYEIVLTGDTSVTVSLEARFGVEMVLFDNGGDPQNCTDEFLEFKLGNPCDVLSFTRCLPAGNWWVRVRPSAFSGIACNTRYRISATCAACTLPTGACCDASVAGCSILAQVACEGRGGQYRGNGTLCAGAGCPGVPTNNNCNDAATPVMTNAITIPFDTSFASDSDLAPAGQDVIPLCGFGNPPGAAPVAIHNDIFYNYKIPTSVGGVTVTQGRLVISTTGSSIDTLVVVYGNTGAPSPSCTGVCAQPQVFCNDDRINDGTNFKKNTLSHIDLPVTAGSPTDFDPGDCVLIRVGRGRGAVLPSRPVGGPGVLNIDFIPTSPAPYIGGAAGTGRCCFYNSITHVSTCTIANQETDCVNAGGKYRQFTYYNQGDPSAIEDYAGCQSDPCPKEGEAC
jgi:hypothetical protein